MGKREQVVEFRANKDGVRCGRKCRWMLNGDPETECVPMCDLHGYGGGLSMYLSRDDNGCALRCDACREGELDCSGDDALAERCEKEAHALRAVIGCGWSVIDVQRANFACAALDAAAAALRGEQ